MWHNHFVCWVVFRPTLAVLPSAAMGLNVLCEGGKFDFSVHDLRF